MLKHFAMNFENRSIKTESVLEITWLNKKNDSTFTFRPFLATYFIFEKEPKNSKKVRL